jgi:four helix bundle protein
VQNERKYGLEDRTLEFAREVSAYCEKAPRTMSNSEYCRQAIRSSGSVGANYIEANEALSKRDFIMRIKILREEEKETRYWLRLIFSKAESVKQQEGLIQESTELMKIIGAILGKSE